MALDSDEAWNDFKSRSKSELNIDFDVSTQKALYQILLEVIIDHFKNNAEVRTTLDSGLNTLFVPPNAITPTDGGATLQIGLAARTALGVKDKTTGNPSSGTGGIT